MITLNGQKFARNNREFTESLFSPGGTCVGYYKPMKRVIYLLDMHGERIGVINGEGVLAKATRQLDGRFWYSYATPTLVGEYASHAHELEECRAALAHLKVSVPSASL